MLSEIIIYFDLRHAQSMPTGQWRVKKPLLPEERLQSVNVLVFLLTSMDLHGNLINPLQITSVRPISMIVESDGISRSRPAK